MNAEQFKTLCSIMINIDMAELVTAGVIRDGNRDDGGSSWKRFNDEPFMFVLKLGDDKRAALWELICSHDPSLAAKPASLQQQVSDYIELTDTLRGARVYVDTARQAAAHQSLRPVLEHTKAVLVQIDKALNDIGAPPEPKEPPHGKAQ